MSGETILVVDDEQLIRWSLRAILSKAGYTVAEAGTLTQGLAILAQQEPDLAILDQMLPDGSGIDLLEKVTKEQLQIPVIMLTAVDRSDVAVQAMKLGAIDYVTKPVNTDELLIVIEKALEATRLKRQVAQLLKQQQSTYGFCGMIGSSLPMKRVFEDILKIASSKSTTVLITGESGTGKELAARAIHFLSERREKPLMTVNFSALSETLIESELFGHERGAFTDAHARRRGVFELADTGTILLDEIGDISPKLQVQLLRVIEEKTFLRLGSSAEIKVDLRIIAATNRPLEQLVKEERFRADLFYRLNVATIDMPPLRDRGDDIVALAEYFIHEFNTRFHKRFRGLDDGATSAVLKYPWPGNVRELRNSLERAVLLHEGELILSKHLDLPHEPPAEEPETAVATGSSLPSLVDVEKQALLQALERAGNNQSKAAKLLNITRDTLRYRIKKYKLFTQ